MIAKGYYTTRPEAVLYMKLPTGEADVWLRKNIEETTGSEDLGQRFTAHEAYMRTTATEAEIRADFERFYEEAAAWQPTAAGSEPNTQEARIDALEKAVKKLEKLNENIHAIAAEMKILKRSE